MKNFTKLIAGALFSVSMIAVTAPHMAQAGTVTIHNENCYKDWFFVKRKRVTVHVDSPTIGCTDTKVTVPEGESRTVSLKEQGKYRACHDYGHEAKGTAFGKRDVPAGGNSSVTCKRGNGNICQCKKD